MEYTGNDCSPFFLGKENGNPLYMYMYCRLRVATIQRVTMWTKHIIECEIQAQ